MSKGTYSHSNRHRMHESLLTKAQRDAWNAMSEIDKLKQEVEQLMKDKERLDWLQSSDLTLHSWEEGDVWARAGLYTIREYIDKEMEDAK